MERQPNISVIVPVFNEAGNLRPLAEEIDAALRRRLAYEVIFVDDGSTDETAAEVQQLAAEHPSVRLLKHDRNRGQSAAVRSGVVAARSDNIAVMDGDGQNDPADIPKLFGRLSLMPSISLVIGERRKRKDNWSRRWSSRVANGVRSRLLKDGISDTGCGLKVFRRSEFLELPAFDHMHRFLPALYQRNGGRVAAELVNHRPRLAGVSKYGIRNRLGVGITDMLGVMWLQRRQL